MHNQASTRPDRRRVAAADRRACHPPQRQVRECLRPRVQRAPSRVSNAVHRCQPARDGKDHAGRALGDRTRKVSYLRINTIERATPNAGLPLCGPSLYSISSCPDNRPPFPGRQAIFQSSSFFIKATNRPLVCARSSSVNLAESTSRCQRAVASSLSRRGAPPGRLALLSAHRATRPSWWPRTRRPHPGSR